ncbi:MAG: hypothetical protein KAV99_03510 [Candidatus Latescibacteria bacterium]|nr:hypothetical protein [Candidatus Latescibacterota bacterium]
MKKFMVLLAVPAVVFLFAGIASAQEIEFWIPQVPTGVEIVIDAESGDWAWFPEAYAITQDKTDDSGGLEQPALDDWDILEYMAWAPPNWLYMYCQISDDVFHISQTRNGNMWCDDCHEFLIDADLSGGNYRTEESHGRTAQQYGVWCIVEPENPVRGLDGYSISSLWCEDELQWAGGPPELVAAVKLPDGIHDVTYAYEVKVSVWDELMPTKEASTPHIFSDGDKLGFTWMWDDNDGEGRESNMGLLGRAGDAWTDADLCAVFGCVGLAGPTVIDLTVTPSEVKKGETITIRATGTTE